ncbi:hypothetical protein CCH79_00013032 [Gambusia affinis]|uniref:Uncharacterized protein n=1 Tax=Gambusia affinis TaxID=33528 RepID=A0A315WB72_GAMAF|nr:hypothetical protein CCH79_00013032 [Gambusia affinis]
MVPPNEFSFTGIIQHLKDRKHRRIIFLGALLSTNQVFVFTSACVKSNQNSSKLCGCGLLGVGIWLSVSQGSFATFSPSFPSLSAANMVIAVGAIVMVTGFLGCLGAIKENKCLLLSDNDPYHRTKLVQEIDRELRC